jgi:DNA/RNA-binding domain of Phe-tRNA-synthetase-like protein
MGSDFEYSIDERVFGKFPQYVRGVAVCTGVSNGPSPPELVAMLREQEGALRARFASVELLAADPRITCWKAAFKAFGMDPKDYRPSMEAMARRVLKSQELPSINALVDIGNVLSLKHLIPMGGHATDFVRENFSLRVADGSEEFVPFGSEIMEHPDAGEIILADGNTVITRRWIWRQGNHTLTLPATKALEFNMDAMPPTTKADVEKIGEELSALVRKFCGGSVRLEMLCTENPRIRIGRD